MRTPEMQRLLSAREHEYVKHDMTSEVIYGEGRPVIRWTCSCGRLTEQRRQPADEALLRLAGGEMPRFPKVDVR